MTTVVRTTGVSTVLELGAGRTVVSKVEGPTTVISSAGQPGLTGPTGSGAGSTFLVTAGATVSGHRVVRPQADGSVVYATNDALGDVTRDLWLTTGAAISGDSVQVQAIGLITEPTWNWSDGPVFLGANGVLTQTVPTSGAGATFIRQVGHSSTPTSLFFNPRTPIVLA